jgi:hypothetical protein
VRHLVGELTGEQFLRLRIYDVLLHTWGPGQGPRRRRPPRRRPRPPGAR